MKQILVLQDTENLANSINMLSLINSMYEIGTFTVSLLALEAEVQSVDGYFHQIITASASLYKSMNLPGICEVVENLHKQNDYSSILIPATRVGRMLAPRIAMRLQTGLVADVTDVKQKDTRLLMVRTAYSGNIMAAIASVGDGPLMMSVHPDTFSYTENPHLDTTISHYDRPIKASSSLRLLQRERRSSTYDIRKSEVLVSGGGGVKRNLELLQQLANSLGGAVSASRKLVDQGLAPRSIQVGQSGKIVRPRLYVALGIHGAIQHIEGLQDVETIISVNISAKAPICSLSDIVVVGDAKDFIEKLLAKIHNNQQLQQGDT